jgi:hypothetical protein
MDSKIMPFLAACRTKGIEAKNLHRPGDFAADKS